MLKNKLLSAMGGVEANYYIEDVFSTWLYTGNDSTQTINNGIDLAGKGGLFWGKQRDSTGRHWLLDSARGGNTLSTNLTDAQSSAFGSSPFTSTGLSFTATNPIYNASGSTYASWTFRKQPKFFDVVTYTGDGSNRTVAHNLGSVPGCIIVKRTDFIGGWVVYHRSLGTPAQNSIFLNSTNAETGVGYWNSTSPTSTSFSLGTDGLVNGSGATYVAYLFAHNAGGFGLTGTDNVISCGSYTGTGSTEQQITLGYEPQWVMIKRTDTTDQWIMVDNMRGFFRTADNALCANTSTSEAGDVSVSGAMQPTATGFSLFNANSAVNASGGTYIYIAIRRGPMKVPTDGTKVFNTVLDVAQNALANSGFVTDLSITTRQSGAIKAFVPRLITSSFLTSTSTDAESSTGGTLQFDRMNGVYQTAFFSTPNVWWMFQRAPGFFDEVCKKGLTNDYGYTTSHNLGVVPELIITKDRVNSTQGWPVWCSLLSTSNTQLLLNSNAASSSLNSMTATSTSITTTIAAIPTPDQVLYLFASCPGVSKIFSYTGNGSSQTINCGFTGGARFVMIKRTDDTGDWYVWDTARGIVSGDDPHLSLNTTAAEVTTDDTIDTDSTGFVVNQVSATNVNVNGATYIGLAIS
jgi:hypothetical protein